MFTINITDKVIREVLGKHIKQISPQELDRFKTYLRLKIPGWLKENAYDWWERKGRIY